MKNLRSGENSPVDGHLIKVMTHCTINTGQASELDVSAFLLTAEGVVRSDSDFIFYNQPQAKGGGIKLVSEDNESQYFTVDLNVIPAEIQKIAFVMTIPVAFSSAFALSIKIENAMEFHPDRKNMQEKSLILAELYRHKGAWKFRALGQGFKGGLAPLATGYGVEIDDDDEAVSAVPVPPQKTTPIQLNKTTVDLKKAGEKVTISLVKGKNLVAKLKWDTKVDLDLYCFYVDGKGEEGKVYYRKLGHLDKAPYIKLLGDSQGAGEEIVEISQPKHIKYALIAAYSALSNGVGSFLSYKARVVVTDNDQQEVTSHLAHKDPYSYWVALALIDFTKAGELTIQNVETYSNKKTFARQFEERTGEKPASLFHKTTAKVQDINKYDPERSPHLFKDGTFMMSVGTREFK
ncbi:hypothetical protein MNBD_GAMMA16-1099 [hydrothermal vent metagenome]|uniref:TerD domain-containing protein n=1 Tax=hydrothermal vent metagenome TaxID=652676 RepID=A0A3B1A2V2_9ZZZZ